MKNETIDNIRVENDREHETVADIVAVLRRYVLPSLAERLEAAWKRERLELEQSALSVGAIVERSRMHNLVSRETQSTVHKQICAPQTGGNAAAMREALEGMCKASQDVFRSFARETFAGERRLDSLGRAFDKAQAALSAPARNCDLVPVEAPEAADVFHSERPGHGYDYETHDWLLAPAAARKEEGDDA